MKMVSINETPVSSRLILLNTASPPVPIIKTSKAPLPHWPGEIQASPLRSIMSTIPKLAGFHRCLPFTFKRNFCPIANKAAKRNNQGEFAFSNNESPSDEINALLSEFEGTPANRIANNCANIHPLNAARYFLQSASQPSARMP
jgi:hypothetical protein